MSKVTLKIPHDLSPYISDKLEESTIAIALGFYYEYRRANTRKLDKDIAKKNNLILGYLTNIGPFSPGEYKDAYDEYNGMIERWNTYTCLTTNLKIVNMNESDLKR